jgi:hypothetical protein
MALVETFSTVLTATIMAMTLTFLIKDNPLYKVSEAILIGTSAGYYAITGLRSVWKTSLVTLITGDIAQLLPLALLLLLFTTFIPRLSWLTRIPTAIIIMTTLTINAVGAVPSVFVKQSIATFYSLTNIQGLIIAIGVITVMFYFIFSIEHKGVLAPISRLGRLFLITGLGAQYSIFVTSRITRWTGSLTGYLMPTPGPYAVIAVAIAFLAWWFMTKDKN